MIITKNKATIILAYIFVGFLVPLAYGQNQNQADSLIELLNAPNKYTDSTICAIYNDIAFYSTQPNKRIQYAKEASKLASRIQDERQLALSLRYQGSGYSSKGHLSEAIKLYLASAIHYSKAKLDLGVAVVYIDLGDIYSKQKNFKNSTYYYNKGIRILREKQDSIRLASALLNTGDLYLESLIYDSALLYFQESEKIFDSIDYPIGKAYCIGNVGLILSHTKSLELGERKIKEAIDILEKHNHVIAISIYQTSLADIYAQRGDLNRALNYAYSALSIGEEEGLKEQIRDASLKLSELYQTQGDYKKAYNYQSQYITFRDSINNEEVIRKMADLRTEYEVGQKQAEVDLKQTEVDLLNEQARNNQIVLWSVIVVLVLVLCLTYALLKVYRVKARAVRIVRQRRRVIAAQRDQLEDVNRTKDKFFSIISHDIRGPISNFQGVSQLIHLLVESKDYDGLLKLGTMLDTSTKEVSSLLDNLLEWAMSQQGRMPYKPETIKLHELCNSNLSIMENLATAKQITLTEKVKEKVTITADKNSISTIIRNLLSNAIKFTPEGGTVDLQLSYDLNMAVLIVKDSGIGIPKEKMQHLFDFKGERSRWGTGGEKGVGLGLTLIHEFVELNKGKIEVDSEEGKGTTFKVYLPLVID
ncbi:MAG: ATP-binding protein [Reichenbachiella sp.]|uniref:ATP-binding protein n=1 Tax=Reichenbachiella sp. TaxID=2184521 RepID=UPI002966F555|nr:ATP-binding protein [Reichenbachiella sp.]MDW3208312.1 ATP-binding protein [Reichenbachiella sp.]